MWVGGGERGKEDLEQVIGWGCRKGEGRPRTGEVCRWKGVGGGDKGDLKQIKYAGKTYIQQVN